MEELVKQIQAKFDSLKWNKSSDNHWDIAQDIPVSPSVIFVNGKPVQQPEQKRGIKKTFEMYYPCEIKDIHTGIIEKTVMCTFNVTEEGMEVQHLEINVYPGELDFFNNLSKKIFGI